jgi:predicted dehydrogenase
MLGTRFSPAFYSAWLAVRGGAIGDVRHIHAQRSLPRRERAPFFHSRATSTGLLGWHGPHVLDWVCWFSQREPRRLLASHSQIANDSQGDWEATAACHILLDDEVSATVALDCLQPPTAGRGSDDRIRVVGTDGTVEVSGGTAMLLREDHYEPLELETPQAFFAAAVQGGAPEGVLPNLDDAMRATSLALTARESADRNLALEVLPV